MFKYLRILSDLHLEFNDFDVPELDTDHETILILAGDIHSKYGAEKSGWIARHAARFKYVIRIMGNHEHYSSSYDRTAQRIRDHLTQDNVFFLDNEFVILQSEFGPVKFIGTTLWTDFNKGSPNSMFQYPIAQNDCKYIRNFNYEKKITAQFLLQEHYKAKQFIMDSLKDDMVAVVITHHAPCELSVHPDYKYEYVKNSFYTSQLENLILVNPNIKFWFHGHIHWPADYTLYDTRIICNPRGYTSKYDKFEAEETHFNPLLRIAWER